MYKSHYKEGILHEQFKVYQNRNWKPRNRAEEFMIKEIIDTCKNPIACTIEQLHAAIIGVLDNYILQYPRNGKCTITPIRNCGNVIGTSWHNRGFDLMGRGRGTYSLHVYDDVMKDAENNWEVVPGELCIYNKFLIE